MKGNKNKPEKVVKLSAVLPFIPVSARAVYHRIRKGQPLPGVSRYEKSGNSRTSSYWLYIAPNSEFYDKIDQRELF